jgi:ATP-dependent DNA ligase
MKPLLAHTYEPHRVTYPCYVQPKLNGIRALYQNGHFQSRDQLPFPKGLLDHLARPLLQTFDERTVLDGELYVHGWPLQRINAAVTPVRLQPTEDTVKVEYHIFDQIDFAKRFHERKLGNCVHLPANDKPPIRFVQHDIVDDEDAANRFYARTVADGYEGIMYRIGFCPYTQPKQQFWNGQAPSRRTRYWSDQDNRCWHLLKRKDWQDDEFYCIDVVEGEGKLKGTLGAVVCRVTQRTGQHGEGGEITIDHRLHVGSGLSDSERAHYWSNPPIGRLVKVKYLCLSEAGIPLNPTILCIL